MYVKGTGIEDAFHQCAERMGSLYGYVATLQEYDDCVQHAQTFEEANAHDAWWDAVSPEVWGMVLVEMPARAYMTNADLERFPLAA